MIKLKSLLSAVPVQHSQLVYMMAQYKAANRPEMSVQLAKAKTAQEVGELIADSWYGYGLEQQADQSGDSYKLSVTTKPATFKAAFRYLWLKPKVTNGNTITYRMMGMPYEISVTTEKVKDEKEDDAKHDIVIKKVTV